MDLKVFKTKKELNKKRAGFPCEPKNIEACAIFDNRNSWKICEVWFHAKSTAPSTLAHEFVHVALEYLRRIKKDDLRERINYEMPYYERPEEILCYAVQTLMDEAIVGLAEEGFKWPTSSWSS